MNNHLSKLFITKNLITFRDDMTTYLFSKKLNLITIALLLSATVTAGMTTDTLFHSDDVLNIQIRTNFTEILAGRTSEPIEYEGVLIIRNMNGSENRLSARISSRGNFRRDPGNCSFPPLKIDLRKKETENTLFQGQNELKLVTPCEDETDVLEEYLVYRMYGIVTDKSLRVRLASIEYFDTGKNKKLFERYSFFLEDKDLAASRMEAVETKRFLTPFDLEVESFNKLAVFQYMIGNKDWYVTSKKNLILMQPLDSTQMPFAVPYDFDFAGFVNADYTRPVNVPLEYLHTRRIFKGVCAGEETLYRALNLYREQRSDFEKIIDEMKLLPRYNRYLGREYLGEFFTMIADGDTVRKNLLESCESRSLYNLSSARSEP